MKKFSVSEISGGASAVVLGATAFVLSRRFFNNKFGQVGVATASALVFYFVGYNISDIVQAKAEENKTK
jgi:lipopolysaccharide export LptBFGC system permease protein LptF